MVKSGTFTFYNKSLGTFYLVISSVYRCLYVTLRVHKTYPGHVTFVTAGWGACHYLTNRFQMKAPVAPSRSLREAFKRAPRSLRGAGLREGFVEPPRRHHEPFAEVYEPFAEVAHTEGPTKTPWRVHEASSKGPWMNCMFLLDHDCSRVWSILYCF